MAGANAKIKRGMKGSNGGRGRWEKTAVLKNDSKKARRQQGKHESEEGALDVIEQRKRLKEVIEDLKWANEDKEDIDEKIRQLTSARNNIQIEINDLEEEMKG